VRAFRVVSAVLARPSLWATSLVQLFVTVPRRRLAGEPMETRRKSGNVTSRWLASAPYWRFRVETVYGPGGTVAADDLVGFLAWCRRMSFLRRSPSSS